MVDNFKERIERGMLSSGDITDKSTFSQAVEWFTKMLAELLEKGSGGRAVYNANPDFINLMHERKPDRKAGGFNLVARELKIGVDSTFLRVRKGENWQS